MNIIRENTSFGQSVLTETQPRIPVVSSRYTDVKDL
jgi:hypothetical protein